MTQKSLASKIVEIVKLDYAIQITTKIDNSPSIPTHLKPKLKSIILSHLLSN
jgi:hypothetical protein